MSGSPAPVACTLSAHDFRERAAWLARLTTEACVGHRIEDTLAVLRYRRAATAEVRKLAALEGECCAFLQFDVEEAGDEVLLRITLPPAARDDAVRLLAHLLPCLG